MRGLHVAFGPFQMPGFFSLAIPPALELDLKWLADHFLPGLLLVAGQDGRDLFHGCLVQGSHLLLHFLAIRFALTDIALALE